MSEATARKRRSLVVSPAGHRAEKLRGPTVDTTTPSSRTLATQGGVTITRVAELFDPAELTRIAAAVDRRRGGVLSSGMEYPGRYSRWHMAYVNPPVEITAHG